MIYIQTLYMTFYIMNKYIFSVILNVIVLCKLNFLNK